MKKIVLFSIGILSLQLSAQNIKLTLLQNSIKIHNDSLYFKYRIQNNSDTILILYNVGMVDVAMSEKSVDVPMYVTYAGLSIFIYNKNDEFQPRKWFTTGPFKDPREPIKQTYEDSIRTISSGKYIVLKQTKVVEYDRRVSLEYTDLEKGIYKVLLKYGFSFDYYKEKYIKTKAKDPRLKNSVLFEGEISSNICSFKY